MDDLKAMLYAGEAKELVAILRGLLRNEAVHGPGTKARRKALLVQIGYLEKRLNWRSG